MSFHACSFIHKVNILEMNEFAYHCTNVNPDIMLAQGFKSGTGGYTDTNMVQEFYDKYLPSNPMFVSSLKAKVWDADAKYCLKIDISGMKKYPDFGHLIDFNAYVDEDCFYWEDKAVQAMLHSKDQQQQRLAQFILNELDDGVLWAADFNGQLSFDLIGTCSVDGDLLDKARVIDIKAH